MTGALATGKTLKFVTCEKCGDQYVYSMDRTIRKVQRYNISQDVDQVGIDLEKSAERELQEALQNECDPVPCSKCGWYQRDMVLESQKRFLGWMVPVGKFILIQAGLAMIIVMVLNKPSKSGENHTALFLIWIILFALLGLSVWGLKLFLATFHNPNKRPIEERKQRGKELATSVDESSSLPYRPNKGIWG